jgi:hypothetical protein
LYWLFGCLKNAGLTQDNKTEEMMWKLLKAEIAYRKDIFLLIFLSSVIFFIFLFFYLGKNWPDKNVGFFFLVYMVFCIVVTAAFNPWIREKRNRRFLLLPVSIRTIGIVRIAAEIIYWFILIALFLGYSLLTNAFTVNKETLLALYAQTGIVLMGYSLACFWGDMVWPIDSESSVSLVEKIIGSILKLFIPVLLFLLGIIQFIGMSQCYDKVKDIYYHMYQTAAGASVLFFPGFILFILSIFVFEHRKSYIEN